MQKSQNDKGRKKQNIANNKQIQIQTLFAEFLLLFLLFFIYSGGTFLHRPSRAHKQVTGIYRKHTQNSAV